MIGPTYTTRVKLGVKSGEVVVNGVSGTSTRLNATSFLSGPAGIPGSPGVGVPTGGSTGQYLAKNSGANYDTGWSTLTKSSVGLSNVDNTSDANKPISTAAQSELNLKADIASPALTGNPTAPTQSSGNNSNRIATTAYVDAAAGASSTPQATFTVSGKVKQNLYNVLDYGATGGANTIIDAAINSSSSSLTSASAPFTVADVGKSICIAGAGSSGNSLKTTISAYISATNVTLASPASTTVSTVAATYGVNDYSAFSTAASAAAATGGVIYVPPGKYYLGTTLNIPSGCTLLGNGYASVLLLPTGVSISANGVSNVFINGIRTSTPTHYLNDVAVLIQNSTGVRTQNSFITESRAFGWFVKSTGSTVCSDIWLQNSYLYGYGNSDVIGGGPATGATGTVRDVHITNNRSIQDISGIGGVYNSAFDIVGSDGVTVSDNTFYGTVNFGFENMAKLSSSISNNRVKPPVGGTVTGIFLSANAVLSSADKNFRISNNTLVSGEIRIIGDATYKIANVAVIGNTGTVGSGKNGITLTNVTQAVVMGNDIIGPTGTVGIIMTTSDTVNVTGNVLVSFTTGISDTSSDPTNEAHGNTFSSVTTQVTGIRGTNLAGSTPSMYYDLRSSSNAGTDAGYFRAIGRSQFGYDGTRVVISDAGSNKPIVFSTNSTERIRVASSTSTGSLGVGLTDPTAAVDLIGSTVSSASLRVRTGVAPSSPNDGDMWQDGSHIYVRVNGVTYQLDQQVAAGTAGGDLTGSYPNPSLSAVTTAGTTGSASSTSVVTRDAKGRITSATDTPIQITESQVTNLSTDLGNKAAKGGNSDITSLTGLTTPLSVNQGGTGTSTSFTLGSVLFAGSSGIYAQDNSSFFWDSTNKRLGIGTATPSTQLEVQTSTGTDAIKIRTSSNAGTDAGYMTMIGRARFGYDGANVLVSDLGSTKPIVLSSGGSTRLTVGSNGQTTFASSIALPITAKTAAYSASATDHTITGDTTSTAFSITLPTAVGITGRIYTIKRVNAGANNLTVATTSSQTIDGATTYVMTTQYKYVSVQSDGANWIIIANN